MPVRVLVVDDSALMRKKIRQILEKHPGIAVVGTAGTGEEAIAKVDTLAPDVVTMDLEMPGQGGLFAIREIMRRRPLPIVVVSSLAQPEAEATVEALMAGAVACVAKPSGPISLDLERVGGEIVATVLAASRASARTFQEAKAPPVKGTPRATWSRLLAVAASTGGPGALAEFFASLPFVADLAAVVVQHMPLGFTKALADHLDRRTAYQVREVDEGDHLEGGMVLVARAGAHLAFDRLGRAHLDRETPPLHGVRPAADVTFRSLAALPAPVAVVVLTGMGNDGAEGAKLLGERGAVVLAQDPESSVVDGMPRSVRSLGIAKVAAPPGRLAVAVGRWARGEAL